MEGDSSGSHYADHVTSKNYSLYLRNKKEGALSHTE